MPFLKEVKARLKAQKAIKDKTETRSNGRWVKAGTFALRDIEITVKALESAIKEKRSCPLMDDACPHNLDQVCPDRTIEKSKDCWIKQWSGRKTLPH